MIFSEKIQKAIDLAIKIHQIEGAQVRKGTTIPVITHLLITGLILARAGADEDLITAGILHDVIEDSTKTKITKKYLEKEFGNRVARIVVNLTEKSKSKYSWDQRKQIILNNVKKWDRDSVFVKSADILHNIRDNAVESKRVGKDIFAKHFNAPYVKQVIKKRLMTEALEKIWPQNPLMPEIKKYLKMFESLGK
ncbi:hypothetical protein A3F07_03145 [candidate division WWE3 bacterium RIFCSPHIGHO2_12_FULL_38_15]|uniref:HD/PDEase domain-containing protein n=1 Tax=candidate division WWE3 bacterium RIFCSPHIGHO2_02_FULL_38_14 TaxID=1802620 RepID=A0A1F4V9V0_UNCKA|nr:MAG: hypothetical protein A2793_04205 [candidate division WWE3 bacterium RIFCSPHIGHO2_01_FULL_38_45]OGC49466.1 MAG: hypothetical protein A3F07_03145 [candidate division WWE3 bacterium RIFCSPHIGHO2_12_FULL_38_15]OGC52724.1 MAG: hypothetical protein A3B64_00930 [candidate division WWE3 bacterium RIFCSPLOWO2_01_FULL_37_24]OGC53918.1 MAG: hypothetical protein A3D91_03985 [candidate division WWE3 bacterium RIFCSPHIGHO2_02_FULL_38_14]HLB52074.1 HD domain-containing protein [Patescibacteria group b